MLRMNAGDGCKVVKFSSRVELVQEGHICAPRAFVVVSVRVGPSKPEVTIVEKHDQLLKNEDDSQQRQPCCLDRL